jgi:hypothetical protein
MTSTENPLLGALGTIAYGLDTPGAYLRGALAGKFGERASGQDLLSSYGLSSADDPWGGVKGFGAEMLLDPLALAGPALGALKGTSALTRGGRALAGLGEAAPLARRLGELKAGVEEPLDLVRHSLRQGESANPLLRGLGGLLGEEEGAIRPFMEIGRRTDPDYVNSVPWWHGTATPGLTPEALDPMKTDPGGLFGRGIYKTADPEIAKGYADERLNAAAYQWIRDAGQHVWPMHTAAPGVMPDLNRRLLNLAQTSGLSPQNKEYLAARAVKDIGRPAMTTSILDMLKQDIPLLHQARDMINEVKPGLRPGPAQSIYEANTNLGKIADLDAPASQELFDALYNLTGGQNAEGAGGLRLMRQEGVPASEMLEFMKPNVNSLAFDPTMPDPLITSLREAGIDALSHTGGLRAGGGRNLHQVLISLDPNDMISHVGRAGQITRFEPQDIPELLRRFGGGA